MHFDFAFSSLRTWRLGGSFLFYVVANFLSIRVFRDDIFDRMQAKTDLHERYDLQDQEQSAVSLRRHDILIA